MSEKVIFKEREPIGSSTYPMPDVLFDQKAYASLLAQEPKAIDRTTSIYIHIPFCDQICSFCGFNKYISTNDKKEAYVNALIKEIEMVARTPYAQGVLIDSVYIGGGTPNTLSANQIDRVLTAMYSNLNYTDTCQTTLEGTPQNFTEDRMEVLKKHGIERVSAGLQTFDYEIRKEHLNMRHSEEELMGFFDLISRHFEHFNLDMIYNLPGHTDDIWARDLELALSTKANHLTIYPLVLLERTAFYSQYVKQGKLESPSQEKELRFFDMVLDRLSTTEFEPHTIRDWAKDNNYCRYIDLNAKCNQVLAFGAGAHGYFSGTTYRNIRGIKDYCDTINDGLFPQDYYRVATKQELMQRFMVMGLRLNELDMTPFEARFGVHWRDVWGGKVDTMVDSGYLLLDGDVISHTHKGHIWANNIRTYFEGNKGKSVGYTDSLGIDSTGKGHYSSVSRVKAAADVEAVV